MKKYNGIDIDYGENLAEIEAYDRSLRVDDDESFEEQIIEIMEEDNRRGIGLFIHGVFCQVVLNKWDCGGSLGPRRDREEGHMHGQGRGGLATGSQPCED